MTSIHQGLASVTITAPDYEDVQLFWMVRRLTIVVMNSTPK